MKLFLFRTGLLGSILFVFSLATTRADFSWEQGQGPPEQKTNSSCDRSATCIPEGCQKVDPAVSMVPDGSKISVIVRSYDKKSVSPYGTCQTFSGSTCDAYPNVFCGTVWIYGGNDCDSGFIWGSKSVYAGNCSPK